MLLATFTSNAVVLGSLLQDRGYKKTRYKHGDAKSGYNARRGNAGGVAGMDFGSAKILHDRWGSDEEDLVCTVSGGDMGSVMVELEEVSSPAESRRLDVPPKAVIKVSSTWEIEVDGGCTKD
jgi:hypothetical protein